MCNWFLSRERLTSGDIVVHCRMLTTQDPGSMRKAITTEIMCVGLGGCGESRGRVLKYIGEVETATRNFFGNKTMHSHGALHPPNTAVRSKD